MVEKQINTRDSCPALHCLVALKMDTTYKNFEEYGIFEKDSSPLEASDIIFEFQSCLSIEENRESETDSTDGGLTISEIVEKWEETSKKAQAKLAETKNTFLKTAVTQLFNFANNTFYLHVHKINGKIELNKYEKTTILEKYIRVLLITINKVSKIILSFL